MGGETEFLPLKTRFLSHFHYYSFYEMEIKN
jgi:hypothetical protein